MKTLGRIVISVLLVVTFLKTSTSFGLELVFYMILASILLSITFCTMK
ncbi:MAG: hypothetical protein ACRC28_18470 [Clostridium sp.]